MLPGQGRVNPKPVVAPWSPGRENSAPSWRERSGALDVESLLERVLGGMLSHPSPRGPGMRKQSGDAVALKFEPDRVLYDPDEDVVRFFANEGPVLIRWAISKAANPMENIASV